MSQEQMEVVGEASQAGAGPAGEANENEAQNQDAPQDQAQDQGQGEPTAEQEQKIAKPVQSNVTFDDNLSSVRDLGVLVYRLRRWGRLVRNGRLRGCMGDARARTPCT